MGKSIKSECVIQILSHPQKHEQVLKFPTHILSVQSGSVTAHKWFVAAWGPAVVRGGELSFHRSSGPGLLTELFLSPRAGWGVQTLPNGPLAPGIHTFHALCVAILSQHSSRQSAWWSCELLPALYLIPQLWFLVTGLPPHEERSLISSSNFQQPLWFNIKSSIQVCSSNTFECWIWTIGVFLYKTPCWHCQRKQLNSDSLLLKTFIRIPSLLWWYILLTKALTE